jgi:hypothetical protein
MSNAKHARRRNYSLINRFAKPAAVLGALLAVSVVPSTATAVNTEPTASAKTVTYATLPLPPRVVGNGQMNFNAVDWLQLGSQARAHIVALENKAKAAETRAVAAENKAEDALSRPDYGSLITTTALAPKVIENLGGKYFGDDVNTAADDRYTVIGTFSLSKGKWLVNTSVQFTRTAAGVAGTRPQIGLRIGQDQTLTGDAKWGKSLGTVSGAEISPANGRDLFGSAVGSIELAETTTVTVYGFGYNDSQGTEGSGQIAAQVTVNPLRVG